MEMPKDHEKCARGNCSCMAPADSKHCSPHCEAAKDMAEISCDCGHEACAGKLDK